MHHPSQGSTYHSLCYTSHGALAGTRNSSMGPFAQNTDVCMICFRDFFWKGWGNSIFFLGGGGELGWKNVGYKVRNMQINLNI